MNIMSNDDKTIIKNTLNSIYGVTGIKSNLPKTNDVNENIYTTSDNRIATSSLVTNYCKYDIKSLNECIDNIVNQKATREQITEYYEEGENK